MWAIERGMGGEGGKELGEGFRGTVTEAWRKGGEKGGGKGEEREILKN